MLQFRYSAECTKQFLLSTQREDDEYSILIHTPYFALRSVMHAWDQIKDQRYGVPETHSFSCKLSNSLRRFLFSARKLKSKSRKTTRNGKLKSISIACIGRFLSRNFITFSLRNVYSAKHAAAFILIRDNFPQ